MIPEVGKEQLISVNYGRQVALVNSLMPVVALLSRAKACVICTMMSLFLGSFSVSLWIIKYQYFLCI